MIFLDHLSKWIGCALLALVLTVFVGGIPFTISSLLLVPLKATASRSVEGSNLRQIAQASLIYAADHHDRLPEAFDLPDYARQLAVGGGLNEPSIWVSIRDNNTLPDDLNRIVVPTPEGTRGLDHRFSKLPHLFTVVIGGLSANDPKSTPLAWTRGLDLETGRWRNDSPYRGEGGHIAFLGGDVRFYRSLSNPAGDELVGRDGRPTHRIRDALPADARISDDAAAPYSPRGIGGRIAQAAKRAPETVRTIIMLAWPVWMLAVFVKLTLGMVRIYGVPLGKLRLEPRASWFLLSPIALLALSFVFRF